MLSGFSQPLVYLPAALLLGLCVGSFLNVVIHRVPRMMEREWLLDFPAVLEESRQTRSQPESAALARKVREQTLAIAAARFDLVAPRSRCPACGHAIGALENIPLISYLALRGKCSACRAPISARYPLVEALGGLGALAAAWHFGLTWQAAGAMVFFWAAMALTFIDQETGYLPDQITQPLLWFGLLLNLGPGFVPIADAVAGAAAGYLSLWSVYWLYKVSTGKEGMGYGDFKMNAAIGALLGWKLMPLIVILSAVVGSVFGIAQMIAARRGWDANFRFHFGPYLALGGIVAMYWGNDIARWYLTR